MKQVKGKQRSANLLIGETGQDVFAAWATKHRLSATKPKEDYGIDFMCHVFRNGTMGSQMLAGAAVAIEKTGDQVHAKLAGIIIRGFHGSKFARIIDARVLLYAVQQSVKSGAM